MFISCLKIYAEKLYPEEKDTLPYLGHAYNDKTHITGKANIARNSFDTPPKTK